MNALTLVPAAEAPFVQIYRAPILVTVHQALLAIPKMNVGVIVTFLLYLILFQLNVQYN